MPSTPESSGSLHGPNRHDRERPAPLEAAPVRQEGPSIPLHDRRAVMLGGLLALVSTGLALGARLQFEFDDGDFGASAIITNDYWGLRLGAPAAAYVAAATDGCEVSESVVTGVVGPGFLAAPYDIQALVVRDREWVSDECDGDYVLVEDTDDWFAQDGSGNVWYLGEDTTAWDEEQDCLTNSGSWRAGDDGAIPGVVMLAEPGPGVSCQQEYYTGEAEHKFFCSVAGGAPGLTLVRELNGKTTRVEYVGTIRPPGSYAMTFPTSDACIE